MSLRSLLIFTLLCALVMAWVYYEREKITAKHAAIEVLTSNSGSVSTSETRFSWIYTYLGDKHPGKVTEITMHGRNSKEKLLAFARFADLESLKIHEADFEPDTQLPPLPKLKHLEVLVSRADNSNFANLHLSPLLESVSIYDGDVDGKLFKEVRGFQQLTEFHVGSVCDDDWNICSTARESGFSS